ncbi:probable carboxylesterase 15 [Ananas comosus]|uniref:Probable carboxylesterase 15 n=1 Tax=Ananas comosus TaxID=4615 RepID=A0A6P5FUG1_ANACO|nr:probable carboxylesterase 15 [Ananas comosus]
MAADDDSSPTPRVVEECRGVLRVYSDGSVSRSPGPSFPVPVRDDGSVEWRDALFDPGHGLHLRLYKPRCRPAGAKLPVFFYFHGGGFCIGSRTWPNCQNYCLRLASALGALVVAPDYRLAPEDPLPAALLDAAAALAWLRSADDDPWLASSGADLARVVVSGDSAGGNIAHHLAVRFGSPAARAELSPVRVVGYVLLMPFFGGAQPTRSESECPADAFLNRDLNDRYWRLALPAGFGLDHPTVNPFGPESPSLEPVEFEPVLVVVGGKDLLRDRGADYAARLSRMGKPVELVEFEGQQHGFFTIDPWSQPSDELMRRVKRFVEECCARSS